jgi:hypothetical protein
MGAPKGKGKATKGGKDKGKGAKAARKGLGLSQEASTFTFSQF